MIELLISYGAGLLTGVGVIAILLNLALRDVIERGKE